MMFDLTGFSPCNGTAVRTLVVIGAAYTPSGCSTSAAATTAAQYFLKADGRGEFMVLLLGNRGWRADYRRIACAYATVLRGPSTRTVTR